MANGTLNTGTNDYIVDNSHIDQAVSQNAQHAVADTSGANAGHANQEHGEHQMTPNDVFPHLLSELGDHNGLIIGPYHIADLPIIFWDNGIHFFSGPKSVEQSGTYKMVEGKPIRTADNGKPAFDISITNLVVFQWIAIIVILTVFGLGSRKAKKNEGKAPNGLQNALEYMVDMVRNKIVRPNIPHPHVVDYLFPYFAGLYFFILVMNFLGLIPGGHTSTGALSVTGALAVTAFFVINITSIKEIGIVNWLKHLTGGAPIWLAPIMLPIEIISMFTKPFALTIRLFANMTAGHVVLLSLVGLIFFFKMSVGLGAGIAITPISIVFSIFMLLLETLVALLQAYIFTILTAVFVGLAIGEHEHAAEH